MGKSPAATLISPAPIPQRNKRRAATCTVQRSASHIDQSRADSTNEKIIQESPLAPHGFQNSAKHPQHKHVHQNVHQTVVKEKVGKRLPDSQSVNNCVWNQAKPQEQLIGGPLPKRYSDQIFRHKYRSHQNQQDLDARSEWPASAKLEARARVTVSAVRHAHRSTV